MNRWRTEDDPYPGPKFWDAHDERHERLWTDQEKADDEAAAWVERVLLTFVVLVGAATIAFLLVVAV